MPNPKPDAYQAATPYPPDFRRMLRLPQDAASRWLTALDGTPDGLLTNTNLCTNLAVFVSLQSQRTPRRRSAELDLDAAIARFGARKVLDDRRILPLLCEVAGIEYRPQLHEQILEAILAQRPISTEAKPKAIESAIGVWRNTIAPHMALDRRWWLVSTRGELATCDDPVVLIGAPGQSREFQLRFRSTPLIIFPVSPGRLLVLAEPDRPLGPPHCLNSEELDVVNLEIVANSLRYVYERPDTVIGNTPVPALPDFAPEAAQTFWEAVLQIPTRWHGAVSAPEWPLQRWSSVTT
ncbi:DUF4238 domain-containing protein [Nocardia takedensis]|uniref:DUF4238 domain-containing protein n=1 Tax=Nocardia takedensis TaxID=259390 RepID=UPI003F777279